MHLWCRLLPQALIPLNLLRPSSLNPRISAYAMLEGNFNFMSTPMAPPGSPILFHAKPLQRRSWAPAALEGWYLLPALSHYRSYTTYITSTGAIRISDTVEFLKPTPSTPMLQPRSILLDAATTLTSAITQPTPLHREY